MRNQYDFLQSKFVHNVETVGYLNACIWVSLFCLCCQKLVCKPGKAQCVAPLQLQLQ